MTEQDLVQTQRKYRFTVTAVQYWTHQWKERRETKRRKEMVENERLAEELGTSASVSNDRVDDETNSPSSSATTRPAWSRSSDPSHPETLLSADAMTSVSPESSLWKIYVFLGQGGSWSSALSPSLFCPLHSTSVPEKNRIWKRSCEDKFLLEALVHPVVPLVRSESAGNHSLWRTNWRMQQLERRVLCSASSLSPSPSCLSVMWLSDLSVIIWQKKAGKAMQAGEVWKRYSSKAAQQQTHQLFQGWQQQHGGRHRLKRARESMWEAGAGL